MYIEQLILEKSLQINKVISRLIYKTEALSAIVVQGNGSTDNFDRIAPSLVDDPVILNVLLAPGGYVSKVYPPEGNEVILGYYYFDDNPGNEEARAAKDLGRLVFGGPFAVRQGGEALVGRMPVYIDTPEEKHQFWGLVSVTLKFPEVLDYADLAIFDEKGLAYELWRISPDTDKKQVIASNFERIKPGSRVIKKKVELLDADWYFSVSSVQGWYKHPENLIFVITGFFISLFVLFVTQNNFELKSTKSALEIMNNTDELTEIYNRRYMDEKLRAVVKATSRSGSVLSLLMIDVDFFKNYNDTYGHSKGDECLKNVAKTINKSLLREGDFVARYGGEEFVVVLPDTGKNGACIIAERLLENVRNCNIPHKSSVAANYVTISIGVTSSTASYLYSGSDYIVQADKAMYMSKQSGRNKYTFIEFETPARHQAVNNQP